MSKRSSKRGRANSQNSSTSENTSEPGHTPKWVRSSPSDSEELLGERDELQAGDKNSKTQEMQCILPGHPPLILESYMEYELHYTKDHNNQCVACRANLPSPWLLELHHEENHNPLVTAKKDDGEKTYRCFLQDCEKITSTPQKRRLHLIDKHDYPRNFDFRLVDSGLKDKSLLQQGKASSGKASSQKDAKASRLDKGASGRAGSQHISETSSISSSSQDSEKNLKPSTSSSMPTSSAAQKQNPIASPKKEKGALDGLSEAMSSLTFVPMSVRMKSKRNNGQSKA